MFSSSKRGSGAYYAKKWKKLPKRCQDILDLWKNNFSLRDEMFTKEDLYKVLHNIGLDMGIDPFYARTSELLGFGSIRIVNNEELNLIPDGGARTKKKPFYKLSIGLDSHLA